MYSKLVSIVVIWLFLVSAAVSAQQSASSGLAGLVTDSSQAAIPGATVTVTNVGTNAQRIAVTDGEGRFSIPALPPATYSHQSRAARFPDRRAAEFRAASG